MKFAEKAYTLFEESVHDYHIDDDVDAASRNPYAPESVEGVLYAKNRIDAVQWHLEDIIRDPDIDPVAALALKRRIDRSNQDRTDMVEEIDSYFRNLYAGVTVSPDATINTESPAWAFDRLSILADLTSAIDALLEDIAAGRKYMKVYRQMKMYNDADTNPVLYGAK